MPDPEELTWAEVLADFERRVEQAAALAADPQGTGATPEEHAQVWQWSPPTSLGPLPEELRARATAVYLYQRQVLADLQARSAHLEEQRDVATRVRAATTAPSRPVYLDLDA